MTPGRMNAIAPSHRWQEPRNRVERFVSRFEPSYRLLIYHAALPLVLTPELLNYLRTQFLPREQVPWIAEVDLLLSDLCRPVGYELYAMNTDIRAYLLTEIQDSPFWQQRMREVAQVLISYVNHLSRMHPGQRQTELQAQRWAAMVYLGDEPCQAAVREIAERLQQSNQLITQDAGQESQVRAELARLSRITQELEPQLRHNESLIEYARLVQRVLRMPATVNPAEVQRSFKVEGIALTLAESLLPPQAPLTPETSTDPIPLAGFPPLAPLDFESATILILPTWKQAILDHLRNWVKAFNQLKKTPSLPHRIAAYQETFEILMHSLQDPEVAAFLATSLKQRSHLLAQSDAHLQPDDFQRTHQLLSAFLRRQADTILPTHLTYLTPSPADSTPDLPHLQAQLEAFASAIPESLEAAKYLLPSAPSPSRQTLERGYLQTVGGLALVIVSDSLPHQDAAKALLLGYFLLLHGMQEPWQTAEPSSVVPLPPPPVNAAPLPPLHPITVEVATLHWEEPDWKIQFTSRRVLHFSEDLGQGIVLEMVALPSGEFLMGTPDEELERLDQDCPQRWVSVPAFGMGRYPITQAQWRRVAALPPIHRELEPAPTWVQGDHYPVREVSWYEAVEFCDRLSQFTGRPYRLPTEAEWEYACRAETTTPFHFGDTISPQLANYNGTHTYNQGPQGEYRRETTPVGYFGIANNFGLSDMHGNVLEWCLDPWHEHAEGAPEEGRDWHPPPEPVRVVRGGCWFSHPQECLSSYRGYPMNASEGNVDIGFRVVCALPDSLPPASEV